MLPNALAEKPSQTADAERADGLSLEQAGLDAAFAQFNRLSQHFMAAYRCLENEVESLNDQLDSVNQDKDKSVEAYGQLAQRYEHLLNSLPVAVIVINGRGIITEVNPSAKTLLNDALVGRSWSEVVREEFRPGHEDGHEVSLTDGRLFRIETQALAPSPGQIIVMSDLTKTRHLQSQLSRQQRLSALGDMMASLCHQVRTPLASAMLYAQHCQTSTLDEPTRERFQSKIVERLQNIERQIRTILKFVRGDTLIRRTISVASFLDAIQDIADIYEAKSQFVVHCDKALHSYQMNAALDDLVGIVANLCDNALQAMSKRAVVARKIEIKADLATGFLLLSICDNGCGLTNQQKAKIFEPFYTTKSQGTGLGLSIVKTVIEQHQGEVSMKSIPDRGTCFRIKLPVQPANDNIGALILEPGVR